MTTQRQRSRAEGTARMAVEAVTGEKTRNELASEHGVHPTPIVQWKRYVPTEGPRLLTARAGTQAQADEALKAQWSQPIGPLKVEVEWLKNNAGLARGGQAALDRTGPDPDQPGPAVWARGRATVPCGRSSRGRALGDPPVEALVG